MLARTEHLISSFNHGCVGLEHRQNNGGVKKEKAMKTGNFPHPTSTPRTNGYLRPVHAHPLQMYKQISLILTFY